jgi:hypothetical protein
MFIAHRIISKRCLRYKNQFANFVDESSGNKS